MPGVSPSPLHAVAPAAPGPAAAPAPLEVVATPEEKDGIGFADVVLHQLWELGVAAVLTAATAPLLLLRALSFNYALQRTRDTRCHQYPRCVQLIGEDGEPGLANEPGDVAYQFALSAVSVGLLTGSVLLAVRVTSREFALAPAEQRRVDRALLLTGLVVPLCWGWDSLLLEGATALGVQLTLWAVTVLLFTRVARVVARAVGAPALKRRLNVTFFVSIVYLSALNFSLGAWYVDLETSDSQRLVWLLLLQPLVVEAVCLPVRIVAHAYGRRHLALQVYIVVLANIVERWMVSQVADSSTRVLAVLAVAAKDVLMRRSAQWRDRVAIRAAGVALPPTRPPLLHIKATFRNIDEIADMFATLVILVITLLFRVTDSRVVPSAWDAVAVCALQLGVEMAADVAADCVSLRFRRSRASFRARCHGPRSWTRGFWVSLVFTIVASALWFAGVQFRPSVISAHCAWTRSGALWAHAPCTSVRGWLG